MRISLLLQREAFGEILCRTLERFLLSHDGRPRSVRWYARRPWLRGVASGTGRSDTSGASGIWLCNKYLNAIFLPRPSPSDLEPVVREFSRSLSARRRLLQRAYVRFATHPVGARLAAHAYLEVTPPVADAEHWLIVGGNHKLRILDRPAGKAIAVLKEGFDAQRFNTEVSTRRLAEDAGLPVPPILSVREDGISLEERYVTGDPLNRLADAKQAARAVFEVGTALARFSLSDHRELTVAEYVEPLLARCRTHATENSLTDAAEKARIERCIAMLERELAASGRQSLRVGLAHGDFQPANILKDGERVWLIDWEFAGTRQIGHDGLVYGLQTRHPSGLADRLRKFVERPVSDALLSAWPGTAWDDPGGRRRSALILALEELALLLEENNNPALFMVNSATWTVVEELERWLVTEETGS